MNNPYMEAIAKPRGAVQENPAVESANGETIFIPKAMCGGEHKKGDEIMLKAKIVSMGSKIGLTPLSIVGQNEDEMGQDEESEEIGSYETED